jgi:hypothetical protein
MSTDVTEFSYLAFVKDDDSSLGKNHYPASSMIISREFAEQRPNEVRYLWGEEDLLHGRGQ